VRVKDFNNTFFSGHVASAAEMLIQASKDLAVPVPEVALSTATQEAKIRADKKIGEGGGAKVGKGNKEGKEGKGKRSKVIEAKLLGIPTGRDEFKEWRSRNADREPIIHSFLTCSAPDAYALFLHPDPTQLIQIFKCRPIK